MRYEVGGRREEDGRGMRWEVGGGREEVGERMRFGISEYRGASGMICERFWSRAVNENCSGHRHQIHVFSQKK